MVKVVKLEIVKPLELDWKVFGDILYILQRECREIANKTIQYAWDLSGYSAEYKKKYDCYPNMKELTDSAGIDGYVYRQLREQYTKHNGGNYICIIAMACDRWKNDIKDVLRGDKSIASFKKDLPIELHNKNIQITSDINGYIATLSLLSNPYKAELGLKYGQIDVALKVRDKSQKSILNRIMSNEYKISASKLIHRKNKWFLNLAFNFEVSGNVDLNKENIMGVDMGWVKPAYMAFNNSIDRDFIDGGEIEAFRSQVVKRQKQLLQQGKYCGQGRIGHGILTRIQPVEKIGHKIENFKDTVNHRYSKRIVDMAIKHQCGVIQMEDLTSVAVDSTFLKHWSYYDLQTKIENKAKEAGIEVRYVQSAYTSQRCSECGHIDKDNRRTQANFTCTKCGFSANADYNAAKNISTQGIDDIIKEAMGGVVKHEKKGRTRAGKNKIAV